ncbi:nudix hydrolase 13, mitochondrial isoform X2 [Manihot esculenta]|uniref:nudix hydrolase 13, mitochondrial isoform X2 n=1 Tax=Manihot esculenta TaxID=3983 RepID=UPI000B5D709D|nr:nudix hydrolase 13, mitochondrial isoform X2 [Manihot esculenta]
MSSLSARAGRQKQLYQDQLRLVAGCIPYKLDKNAKEKKCRVEDSVLILMISTPNREDLVFPKEKPLGVWEFRSKRSQNSCSLVGGCKGYMFALEVTEELDKWPGQATYIRKWLKTEEAFKFCRYDWMREALKNFLAGLSKNDTHEKKEESTEMVSSGCFVKPPGDVQHHEQPSMESCLLTIYNPIVKTVGHFPIL